MRLSVSHDQFRFAEVFTISRGSRSVADVLTVRASQDGITGWGECVPYARYGESIQSVRAQIESLPQGTTRTSLQSALPPGAARNAVDCALWDWQAKQSKTRAWQLAGLPQPRPEVTAFTLSLGEPDAMEAQARKNAHMPLLKVKLGTSDDLPRLEAVRRGAPNSRLILDANEGWRAEDYAELAPKLLELGVALVEQPLPAGEDDALLGMKRPVPLCADESCHDRQGLEALVGKYDVINIKLDKTGGLSEALALRQMAEALGFKIMVGCMVGSSLAMAPATLIAQGAMVTDLDGPLLLAQDRSNPLEFDAQGVHPPKASLWG